MDCRGSIWMMAGEKLTRTARIIGQSRSYRLFRCRLEQGWQGDQLFARSDPDRVRFSDCRTRQQHLPQKEG